METKATRYVQPRSRDFRDFLYIRGFRLLSNNSDRAYTPGTGPDLGASRGSVPPRMARFGSRGLAQGMCSGTMGFFLILLAIS